MKRLIRPQKKSRGRRTPENSREHKVLLSVRSLFPQDPYIYQGYYSWLKSVVDEPLQIDIFFTKVGALGERALAIEVQGDQHRGKWRRAVKRFFKTEDAFERQIHNDIRKKELLLRKGVLFIELWPEESIEPEALQEKIEKVAGVSINAK